MNEASHPQTKPTVETNNATPPSNVKDAVPKDAAAVILLRRAPEGEGARAGGSSGVVPEVYWARRSERMAFLGGFYAFPGGQREASDADVEVEHAPDAETATMIACAARELFEEVGVLAARGAETLTIGQRASVLDDLTSGRMTFPALLKHYGLRLDARDFTFAGRWVTPPFSPRRFDTFFFLVHCPRKQEPRVSGGELESGEWVEAGEAVARWQRSEALVAPPVLHALRTLAVGGTTGDMAERLLSVPQAHRQPVRRIEFVPGFICFPVRTKTLPPATHTNCYIVGGSELVCIDPASPDGEEQAALAACIDELSAGGRTVREIILTHLHPDHVGGVNALREHIERRTGVRVPIAAHRLTAQALEGNVTVSRLIEDDDLITLAGDPAVTLRAMHTPGHARGHLCFYEGRTGAVITGDNIVGLGSVLIDPPEGNMRDYLRSLERLRELPKVTVLFGAHGPAVGGARAKIDEYIAHRLEREQNILAAVRDAREATAPAEIVAQVYRDVHPKAHALAARAVLAHLEKLVADGLVASDSEGRYFAVSS